MNHHDPYSAPGADLRHAPQILDIESTGKWRRFFNWLTDSVVQFGIKVMLFLLVALFGGEPGIKWLESLGFFGELAIGYAVFACYYTAMEGAFGLTIGKLITNTRVVDEYGRPPGFKRAVLRTLARMIPFEALSLLFSADDERRAWHDSLPRCYVVNRPRRGQPVGTPRASISEAFAATPGSSVGTVPQTTRPEPVASV